jgi:isocitrate/isopropylmalate dehydrogenase
MMEYLGEYEAAKLVEEAVMEVLSEGKTRTYDLGGNSTTQDVSNALVEKILQKK